MFLHVEEAKYLRNYKIWLRLNDGTMGEINLSNELEGEVFEPLKSLEYFQNFEIRGHTLSWENGADFAPEFLKEKLNVNG
jgi:Protein of unknown function (DUF2442)